MVSGVSIEREYGEWVCPLSESMVSGVSIEREYGEWVCPLIESMLSGFRVCPLILIHTFTDLCISLTTLGFQPQERTSCADYAAEGHQQ
jgi:hypothetical protein